MEEKRGLKTFISRMESGRLLIDWLCRRFTYRDRDQWHELVQDGRVLANGARTGTSYQLRNGDIVEYIPEAHSCGEPEVPRNYRILYRDRNFIVVDKPGGLPCHPAGRYRNNTLWNMLKPEFQSPSLVNRLDRETSGLMLVALTPWGRRHFDRLQSLGKIQKEYLLVVHGKTSDAFEARGWIGRDMSSVIRKKQRYTASFPETGDAKSVSTLFTCIARKAGYSLLTARLETGRTHQIRASVYGLGFPLLGDKIYGLDETLFLRFCDGKLSETDRHALVLSNQALHSAYLRFVSPDGEELEFSAGLPRDFAEFVDTELGLSLGEDREVGRIGFSQCR